MSRADIQPPRAYLTRAYISMNATPLCRLAFALAAPFLISSGLRAQTNRLHIPDTLSGTVFNLTVDESTHNFIPGKSTATIGINGSYLGPTLFLNQGDSVRLNVINNLSDHTTMHWHGLHVPAGMDGGPHQEVMAGMTWSPEFKVMDRASVFWYHSHLHEHTHEQVNLGQAGMIIVRDAQEAALPLPRTYGKDDFPLILQDRRFNASGQLVTSPFGDSVVINGTMHPFLDVPAQVVRFRVLNGNNERVYNLGFSDNRTFYQIGSDGGLLTAPVPLTRLMLAPGERAELLVDFGSSQGSSVKLRAYNASLGNGIPGFEPSSAGGAIGNALGAIDFDMLTINVAAPTANPVTAIPTALANHTRWTAAQAQATRTLTFTGGGPAPFLINNTAYDMAVNNYTVPLGNIEIWELVSNSGIAHPFHIHDIQFYILSRDGAAPAANEAGLKDVVLVKPNETVRFITRFTDFADAMMPYMYHCHILPHEDAGMMGQFVVVDTTATGVAPGLRSDGLRCFPNPATGRVRLTGQGPRPLSATVRNSLGQTVLEASFPADTEAFFDVSALAPGVYSIQVRTEGGAGQAFRLVRE